MKRKNILMGVIAFVFVLSVVLVLAGNLVNRVPVDSCAEYWDNGNDPFTTGVVTSSAGVNFDYCVNNETLKEFVCMPGNNSQSYVEVWEYNCSTEFNSTGCFGGHCVLI